MLSLLLENKNNSLGQCNKDITIKCEWSNLFVTLVFKTATSTYWKL